MSGHIFALDTNIVIGIMTGRAPGLRRRLSEEKRMASILILPAIVMFELRYGAVKSDFPKQNLERLNDFLAVISEVLPFTAADAEHAGDIRATLEADGLPIGPFDYLIAAQARRRGMPLVTLNRREFDRVPGLRVMDWS